MPSHSWGGSVASTLSAMTDLSNNDRNSIDNSFYSDASVYSATSNDFKKQITVLIQEESLKIKKLESRAQTLIVTLRDNATFDVPPYSDAKFREQHKLHWTLDAMLHYVEDCGGDKGKCYAACAIYTCSEIGEDHLILPHLQSLATTWLSHLLFVFKANHSHRIQQNPMPSPIAMPTREDTATYLDKGTDQEHEKLFTTNVILRDGYRCAVTGCYDEKHPQVPPKFDERWVKLRVCYILQCAIGVFKGQQDSEEYASALTTFNILRNYADLPIQNIEDIADVIDDVSNGLSLDSNAHDGFDNFRWSLQATEIENEYTTVIHDKKAHGLAGEGLKVTFADYTRNFQEPSSPMCKKLRSRASTAKSFAVPNPLFIRIHHAIAGILHMSAAGENID